MQETEGTVVLVVPDPAEDQNVEQSNVMLRYCPQGAWVAFEDCKPLPLAGKLASKVDPSAREALWALRQMETTGGARPGTNVTAVSERLVFVPAVTRSFTRHLSGTNWQIRRRQLPLTSALDRTIQSSQGKTFRAGIVGDMGNANCERGAFWSALYVLLSRATQMEDLLLFRCPPKSFFDEGPPQYLKEFLRSLHGPDGRIEAGRKRGDELIHRYGWKLSRG